MTIDVLTTFLGWCSTINIVLLMMTSLLLIGWKEPISQIHSQLFALEQQRVLQAYFHYLANYKIAVLILNIVPYFSLKIMTG
ncbi:MAG: hypothetical protein KZQ64_06105 [gamma proteobacterium symbiont of Bathyaustriella thionipta]|nr:hypothetical protein [gamma proteobacterium symbiont of Bathyaustriella thionipta]MCU7949562.1 hypothetical protein [gamma proteobacterium symbiont of Bathyaustriella thionipta]MCU7952950.1 hypothetical protein [gamma proteobacterium symbiont of Bathyaustriella thionipta]MCU7956154.1 hypothetical protein [gamma proteobacterium symbiont of Bathyaustriella thionipta]MCU7966680.1 hypothetical protein [gamma proteobacterium symbiont of Bathyaustriella thionipta]